MFFFEFSGFFSPTAGRGGHRARRVVALTGCNNIKVQVDQFGALVWMLSFWVIF